MECPARGLRPVGTFDNSPAIHRWVEAAMVRPRPVGTIEPSRIVFNRPYGTEEHGSRTIGPSSELLGYFQTPLRGKGIRIISSRTCESLH